jgi:hypothetical protein
MKKFIPKISDTIVLEVTEHPVDTIFFEASHCEWRRNVLPKIQSKSSSKIFLLPGTSRIGFAPNKNFSKLPYYVKPADICMVREESGFRRDKILMPTIQYQIDKGMSSIVLPTLYFDGTSHPHLHFNIEFISSAIKYKEDNSLSIDYYVPIHTSKNVLIDDNQIRYLWDMYTTQTNSKVSGYIITINDLNEKTASEEELLGLIKLVNIFSQDNKTVFITNIGDFGNILLLYGADGYSCGLGTGETHSIATWDNDTQSHNGRRQFVYIPEIFNYINDAELARLHYQCTCKYCQNGYPLDAKSKKLHFLINKLNFIKQFNEFTDFEAQLRFIEKSLRTAQSMITDYQNNYQLQIRNSSYIGKWIRVCDKARTLNNIESLENKLESLVLEKAKELKNATSNS